MANLPPTDTPDPPANFKVTPLESDNRTVQLTWKASTNVSEGKEVEGYVLEQSINGGGFHEVSNGNYHVQLSYYHH